jgi:hypothetical protein
MGSSIRVEWEPFEIRPSVSTKRAPGRRSVYEAHKLGFALLDPEDNRPTG